MNLDKKIQILTGWCASSPKPSAEKLIFFQRLVQCVPQSFDGQWTQLLRHLSATRLIRLLEKSRQNPKHLPLDLTNLSIENRSVLWDGEMIGTLKLLYKRTLPHETQAKIAYEIFYERYERFLMRKRKLVVTDSSDYHIELFVPAEQNIDFEQVWSEFINDCFSRDNLESGFVNLVNTIKMTERGFSALSVPITSAQHAVYLAAFYTFNINSLIRGDNKRKDDIEGYRQSLENEVDPKKVARLEKNIAKTEAELAERLNRYQPVYDRLDSYREKYRPEMVQVDAISRKAFTPIAGTQIAKSGAKIGKCVADIGEMFELKDDDYFRIPPLLTETIPTADPRPAGDSQSKVCYSCGQTVQKKEPVFSANKFIFSSPSQRAQSAAGQAQPKICGTCAAISFLSPIKIGSGRLIVRMREHEALAWRSDDQLRMFTMGELNIVAGKYVILQANESVGDKLVADQLGGEPYAIYKVGSSFSPLLFEKFRFEAVLDGSDLPLKSSHLAWIHQLGKIFHLVKNSWGDKRQFAAFGRAVRHIQKDDLIFAIYELFVANLLTVTNSLPLEIAVPLEQLRDNHVEWLIKMKQNDLAQQYRDVAAMTALLFPFLRKINEKFKGDRSKQRIEVRKIIERSDEPQQVIYTIAPHLADLNNSRKPVRAYLYRNADTYFSYDQLSLFLTELESQPEMRESDRENSLPLTLDDITNAYAHLYSGRYASEKARREFAYKLKLSLAARFPQHYQDKKNN